MASAIERLDGFPVNRCYTSAEAPSPAMASTAIAATIRRLFVGYSFAEPNTAVSLSR